MHKLSILDNTGDTKISWDHDDEKAREEARATIIDLKNKGYSFFTIDNLPADEVTVGAGSLECHRTEAETLLETYEIDIPDIPEIKGSSPPDPIAAPAKGRGRPTKDTHTIAVRPLRGG